MDPPGQPAQGYQQGYQQGGYPAAAQPQAPAQQQQQYPPPPAPPAGAGPAPQQQQQQQQPYQQQPYQQQYGPGPPAGQQYQQAPANFQQPPQGTAPPPGGPPPPGDEKPEGDHEGPASPPPLSDMDRVQGYEDVNFQADAFIPPPAYEAAPSDLSQSPDIQPDIPTISEDVARDALLREVSAHCCYGKKAARELVFTNIVPSSAFHYQLETFTEGRKTAWAFTSYTGQPIDGPQNGPAPGPWDISAQPSEMFSNHLKVFEVPHTASVKVCHGCLGAGMIQCRRCLGAGQVTCNSCSGTGRHIRTHVHHDHHHHGHHHHGHHHHGHHHHGHHHHGHHHHGHSHVDVESVPCMTCHGSGRKRCYQCSGSGRTKCSVCNAKGQLKCYIKLTVSFKNNKVDHVVERTALPDHLIRGAQGKVAFQDTRPRVFPVTGFPDAAVNDASRQLVESHAISFPTERILSQRHWIRIVPVSEARCDFKGKTFSYWVYGEDCNVHAPDYPQQVCWGCSIL